MKFRQKLKYLIKSDYFWILVLLIAIAVYIYVEYNPLFTSIPRFKRYLSHDFIKYFFPQINSLLSDFEASTLSVSHWDHFSSAGTPKIMHSGVYYLPNYLLKIIFKTNDNYLPLSVYQIFTLGHHLLSTAGAFLFFRYKKNNVFASSLGAFVFSFTSIMLTKTWTIYVFAIALLPWILFLLEKYKNNKNVIWLFLASFIAFQQLAVCPQFFMYSVLFIAIYFLFQDYSLETKKTLLFFGLLICGYSSIFLFPLYEFNSYVVRLNFLDYDVINAGATQTRRFGQLVLYPFDGQDYFLYLGGAVIALIIIYFDKTKSKFDWLLLSIAIIFLLLGTNTSLFQALLRFAPGLSEMRFHNRANEIVVFIMIIFMVKSISNYKYQFRRDFIAIGVTGILIVFAYLINANFEAQSAEQFSFALTFLALFGLSLVARHNGLINDKVLIMIVGIIILLDITRIARYVQDREQANFQLTPTGKIARTEWFFGPNQTYATDNNYRIPADDFFSNDYNKFLINRNFAAGSYSASGGEGSAATLKNYDDYLKAAQINPNLLRLANINTSAGYLPRAFTLSCYKVETDADRLLTKLQDKNFTGENFIYLSSQPKIDTDYNHECQDELTHVTTIQDQDKINFSNIITKKPTLLFISDNWYPGWKAVVNGQNVEVLRANYTFKAVVLPVGDNRVEFKYNPSSYKIGGLITLLSISGSVIFILYQFAQQLRRRNQ